MKGNLKLDASIAYKYLSEEELAQARLDAKEGLKTLLNKSGEGNDFLGWVDYPVTYVHRFFPRSSHFR